MTGLEKITEKIISDAKQKAEEIIAQAENECEQIKAEAETKKQEIENRIEAEAVKEGESIKNRAMSSVAMNKREIMFALRADLIEQAFENAKNQLLALDPDKYREMLSGLLSKVICDRVRSEKDSVRLYGEDISPGRYEILMNKKDRDSHGQAVIDGARRMSVGKLPTEVLDKIFLSDRSLNIDGGFVVKCGDVELNCSLEMLLSEVRPGLESAVANVLFPVQAEENKENK